MEEGSDQPPSDAYLYALRDEAAYLQADEDEKPEIIAEPPPDPAWFKCWFCRRTDRRVLFGAEYPGAGSHHLCRHHADLHLRRVRCQLRGVPRRGIRGLDWHSESTVAIGLAVPGLADPIPV